MDTRACRTGRWLSLPPLAALLLVVAPAEAAAQSPVRFPGDPIAGRQVFVEHGCERCHSIWGNGGTLGPDFAMVGAGRSLQQLAGLFWNHTPRMIQTVRSRGISWPVLSEDDVADLISYIQYIKLFDEPGDADLGRRWFSEKGCSECHSVGGTGGDVGPALDDMARYVSTIKLSEEMWNHGKDMRAEQISRGVAIPTFRGREMADIQAYLRESSDRRGQRTVLLQPPDPNRGRDLFAEKRCTRCHGPVGRGTRHGPDLREATQRLRVAEIAGELWNHSPDMAEAMPARGVRFPNFEGDEMADVIAFLYYLRFYESEANVEVGELLFFRKGCSGCHNPTGSPVAAPDLALSKAVHSPLGLATAMWNHSPAMYDLTQERHIEWPRFEGDEMRDLAAYLAGLGTR